MARGKKIPQWLILLVAGLTGYLIYLKFQPLILAHLPKPPIAEAATTPPPVQAPVSTPLPITATLPPPTPEPVVVSTPAPTATSDNQYLSKPELLDVVKFLDRYVETGNSDQPVDAGKQFLKFPLVNFFEDRLVGESAWTIDQNSNNAKYPARLYARIGAALFGDDAGENQWSATAPIEYTLKNADGTTLQGITLDRFVIEWKDSELRITSQQTLGMRTLVRNGIGTSPDEWRYGTVKAKDGNAKLRSTDDDSGGDATVLKECLSGSPIKFLPQSNQRWLIVMDRDHSIGFMASRLIVPGRIDNVPDR